jgi:hypothetical protein
MRLFRVAPVEHIPRLGTDFSVVISADAVAAGDVWLATVANGEHGRRS